MDEKTITLLNNVAKNAEMGKNTLRQLLCIVENQALKEELHKQLDTYEDLNRRASAMLCVEGELPEGQSNFARINTSLGIKMNTMKDSSPRHIAEMLIQGCHMGVTDMVKEIKDANGANPGAIALAARLQNAEETYAEDLKSFL